MFTDFLNSDDCNQKHHIEIYQTTTSFYLKKDLKLIKNRFFLKKKWEIQVIAHSFFGDDL